MEKHLPPATTIWDQKQQLIQALPELEACRASIAEQIAQIASVVASDVRRMTFIKNKEGGFQTIIERLQSNLGGYIEIAIGNAQCITTTGALQVDTLLQDLEQHLDYLNRVGGPYSNFTDLSDHHQLLTTLEASNRLVGQIQELLIQEAELAKLDLQHARELSFRQPHEETPPWDTTDPLYLTEMLAAPLTKALKRGEDGFVWFPDI